MAPSRTPTLSTLRARWPLALLLAGIGLTAIAALDALRVDRSNSVVATKVLREYASFAAWSYAQHAEETLRGMAQEVVGAVNHGDALHMSPQVPDADDLPHYLRWDERCACHRAIYGPNPETFIAFDIQRDWMQFAINTHPNPAEGWEVDRPMAQPVPHGTVVSYTDADRTAVLRAIKTVAHEHPDPAHGYTYVPITLSQGPKVIAYTLMPTVRGDTLVYGAQYSAQAFASVLRDVMDDNTLLPASFSAGRRNRDLVRVAVTVPGGDTVFASDPPAPEEQSARVDLSPRFASMSIDAAIRESQAGTLVVGGLPRSRLPFVLGLLGLAAALTVVAVMQLRRETELARVRGEWIASVSHELRTPLAQIRLYVDTVRLGRAPSDERRDWALSQVDRETTRLSHLVEKVLTFSRFGRDNGSAPQPTDVAAETTRIVEEFRPLAAAKNVIVDTDVDAVPPVPLRRDSLRHILLNLLDNAVKYGPAGQRVRVEVARRNGEVQIAVADEGPGIGAGEREAIWRPFTRGRASAEQGGSGIGLTIVHDVAVQHGGRVWVERGGPAGGARFVVALPTAADGAAAP
jgi:signal transduction histidine kinase